MYIQRWAGLPPSATNLVLHMKEGLDLMSIETLYMTCHTLTHTAMRLKGDSTVNAAIDNSILRELQWTHKRSTVIACEAIYELALDLHCPGGEMPNMQDRSKKKENVKLSHDTKSSVQKKVFSDLHDEQKKTLRHTSKARRVSTLFRAGK